MLLHFYFGKSFFEEAEKTIRSIEMNTKAAVRSVISTTIFIFIGLINIAAQQSLRYKYEYYCNKERIVVDHCRNDPAKPGFSPVPENQNYCLVYYPDRPKQGGFIVQKTELRSDIIKTLNACGALQLTEPVSQASIDTSIAKAKAAKVDLGVFGLEIGQALQLPACPLELFPTAIKQTCMNNAGAKLADSIFGPDEVTAEPEVMLVTLDAAHCPDWLSGCQIKTFIAASKLVGVSVVTKGRLVENAVNDELNAKYGVPTHISRGKITPDIGNAFEVRDPEWALPGLRVEYQVVRHDENGVNTSAGWVRVITESEYQRIQAAKKPTRKM